MLRGQKISTSHRNSAKINYEVTPHFIMTMTVVKNPQKNCLIRYILILGFRADTST